MDPVSPFNSGVDESSKISVAQCYFNLFKVYCGITIIALPAALATVGVVGGNVIIAMSGAFNYYTIKLQVETTRKIGEEHVTCYSDLG